jgi:hypothetical protein
MSRCFDKVGYELPGSTVNGVWTAGITERDHYGEVLDATRSLEPSEKVNDDFRLQNRISIVADAFALENFAYIKYVFWMGTRWTVNTVKIERPRLILSLGGVYHGRIPEEPAPITP